MVAVGVDDLPGIIANQQARNDFIAAREQEARRADQGDRHAAPGNRRCCVRARRRSRICRRPQRARLPVRRSGAADARRHLPAQPSSRKDRKVTSPAGPLERTRVRVLCATCRTTRKFLEKPELIEIHIAGRAPRTIQRRLFDFALSFRNAAHAGTLTAAGERAAGRGDRRSAAAVRAARHGRRGDRTETRMEPPSRDLTAPSFRGLTLDNVGTLADAAARSALLGVVIVAACVARLVPAVERPVRRARTAAGDRKQAEGRVQGQAAAGHQPGRTAQAEGAGRASTC